MYRNSILCSYENANLDELDKENYEERFAINKMVRKVKNIRQNMNIVKVEEENTTHYIDTNSKIGYAFGKETKTNINTRISGFHNDIYMELRDYKISNFYSNEELIHSRTKHRMKEFYDDDISQVKIFVNGLHFIIKRQENYLNIYCQSKRNPYKILSVFRKIIKDHNLEFI